MDNEQIQVRLRETIIPERTVTSILGAYRERFSGKNCYGR